MKTIHGITAYFDVDDTLLMWGLNDHPEAIEVDFQGVKKKLVVHKTHITKMEEHKFRGHRIIVWSAGGSEWAEYVVKLLKIEHLVDLVITKPDWYYDDLRSEVFMPENTRVYYTDYKGRDEGHR